MDVQPVEEIFIDFCNLEHGINDPKATAIINFCKNILNAETWFLNDDEIQITFN